MIQQEKLEVFVHGRGTVPDDRLTIVTVGAGSSVRGALGLAEGDRVWDADTENELDLDQTFAQVGVGHRCHVHVNRCPTVSVSVTYNGATKTHRFPTMKHTEWVFSWAVDKFGLDATDAEGYELHLPTTNEAVHGADHIGSYADDDCAVTLNLVPKVRNAG